MSTPTVTELSGIRFNLVRLPDRERRRQVRFPRSKKARIRKKFAKDPSNWVVEKETDWFLVNQTILQEMIRNLLIPARMLPEIPISTHYSTWRPRMEFAIPTPSAFDPYFALPTS